MSGAQLKSHRFRAEREDEWRRLDRILRKAETRSLRSLTDEELVAMPALYRATLSALASARATSLDHALVDYLESLCERAYYFLYGVRGRLGERFAKYLGRDLPAAVKSLWRETLVAFLLTVLSAAAAFYLVHHDPDWFYAFINDGDPRNPSASAEELRKIIYGQGKDGKDALEVFATYLFSHNAQLALACFALGFAFCAPTVFLLVLNGTTLGAFLAIHFDKGLGYEIGGWLSIHGVTEISAFILAAAAGLHIGWRIGFPGSKGRLAAAREAGRTGAVAMGGAVIMLMFAGMLEGFGRQLITNDIARYAIGWSAGLMWVLYYYLPRKARPLE